MRRRLRVEIVGAHNADAVARQLRGLDSGGLLRVSTRSSFAPDPPAVGLVISAPEAMSWGTAAELEAVADIILQDNERQHEQVERLYAQRISAFAAGMAGKPSVNSAPVLRGHDPGWATAASRYLGRLRAALAAVGLTEGITFEHVGSTAVPDLRAKSIVDLQIQVPELRHDVDFDEALPSVGFRPAEGSRPDSPGVYRDIPRGSYTVADHVWDKRLFLRPDPGKPSILHIRKVESPWGRYTILFRDWLRQHPAERVRYQQTKSALAGAHAGDPDYDDYTRAKTAYFDGVQARFERYGLLPARP